MRIKPFRTAVLALSIVAMSVFSLSAHSSHAAGSNQVRKQALSYHRLWTVGMDANADSPAITVDNVSFPGGSTKNVVLALAGNNDDDCDPGNAVSPATTYAFDASNGHQLWSVDTKGKGRCTTSRPAVYKGFVYSTSLDGRIHKYALTTGVENKQNGWPKLFTLNPYREKQSSNLRVSAPYLYVTISGFTGDAGHYEGHIVTINLDTNHVTVWNSLCSKIHKLESPTSTAKTYCQYVQNGMFGRGQAVSDPLNGDIYVVTGNGPWNGKTNWGDSILKLSHDGSKLLDAFTPTNQQYLDDSDSDLGSTSPDILPPVVDKGKTYHLLVQGGKGGSTSHNSAAVLWLVKRGQMGSKPGPGSLGGQLQHIDSPGGCEVLTAPAVWTDSSGNVYAIYANDCGIESYQVKTTGSHPQLATKWSEGGRFSTPVIVGNIMYIAQNDEIDAMNPADGNVIWSSNDTGVGGTIGGVHWEYPTIDGNMLYMTDENAHLIAYRKTKPAVPLSVPSCRGRPQCLPFSAQRDNAPHRHPWRAVLAPPSF